MSWNLISLLLCVIISYMTGGTYRFFKNLFIEIEDAKAIFSKISRCLTWGLNPDFTSNKPIHYLLDYGDFRQLFNYAIFGNIVMS